MRPTFLSVDETLKMKTENKTLLWTTYYAVQSNAYSILKYDHLHESYRAVISFLHVLLFGKQNVDFVQRQSA